MSTENNDNTRRSTPGFTVPNGNPVYNRIPNGAGPNGVGPNGAGPNGAMPQNMHTPVVYRVTEGSSRGIMSVLFIMFLLFLLVVSFLFNCVMIVTLAAEADTSSISEKTYSGSSHDSKKIAIIEITGTIMDGEDYREEILKAMEDDSVAAVVLRVDSPGGTISGSDYIFHQLSKVQKSKPIVVSMGSMAASGGYYVSMCVGDEKDVIFAEPTCWTGSIGVIISHYDASELFMEKLGVKNDPIKSGTMKGMGSMIEPMTADQRSVLQSLVDDSFARFKDVIKHGRPCFVKDPKKLDDLATGQVYNTKQALELGLIDKEGFLDDAIDRAKELAGITDAHVVVYESTPTLSEILLGAHAAAKSNPVNQAAQLFNAATPRAYYLWTTMSPLYVNQK